MISPITAAVAGVRLFGLIIAVLPAAKAATVGSIARWNGTFQGPRIRQTPRASYSTDGLVFGNHGDGSMTWGCTHWSSSSSV